MNPRGPDIIELMLVGLILALLAAIAGIAFARRAWRNEAEK